MKPILIKSYREASELIESLEQKDRTRSPWTRAWLYHNTYLTPRWRPALGARVFDIYFYDTRIVRYLPGGTVVINNGGFITPTTKRRINMFTPDYIHVFQMKNEWYANCGRNGEIRSTIKLQHGQPNYIDPEYAFTLSKEEVAMFAAIMSMAE